MLKLARFLRGLILALTLFHAGPFLEAATSVSQEFSPELATASLVTHIKDTFKVPQELAKEVVDLAFQHGKTTFPTPVDILAVTAVESKFKPKAVSPGGGNVGLMQISLIHRIPPSELRQPALNVAKGVELLSSYRALSKSDSAALVAFNAGPGAMLRICNQIKTSNKVLPCSTEYSRKVLNERRKMLAVLQLTAST